MKRPKIDRELCIGSANCVYIAPELISIDAEDIATVASGPEAEAAVAAMSEKDIAALIDQCPAAAISVEEF